jgi:hypothetical protein
MDDALGDGRPDPLSNIVQHGLKFGPCGGAPTHLGRHQQHAGHAF